MYKVQSKFDSQICISLCILAASIIWFAFLTKTVNNFRLEDRRPMTKSRVSSTYHLYYTENYTLCCLLLTSIATKVFEYGHILFMQL